MNNPTDYDYGKMLAASVYANGKLTDEQKIIIKFGMIPIELMREAEESMPGSFNADMSRGFTVGLMKYVGIVV